MMKILIALLVAVLMAGCTKPPESSTTVNPNFQVDKLFTVEGCTVYRFEDGGYYYFTNCSGSVEWTENCGKNCTRRESISGGRHGANK